MTLQQAWAEHADATKRFRKEMVNGNVKKAREQWERAHKLWLAISGILETTR